MPSIRFIGHSTTLISLNGRTLLTDPFFRSNMYFLEWRTGPPPAAADFDALDAIVISHAHNDHFDKKALAQLPHGAALIAADGVTRWLDRSAYPALRPAVIGTPIDVGGVTVTPQPARHATVTRFGGANSFVIEGEKTLFFAGDMAFFDGLADIGAGYDIDVALLPVSDHIGWPVTRVYKNIRMNTDEALRAAALLNAHTIIPIHWGFSIPLLNPAGDAERLAERAAQRDDGITVTILQPGETLEL